MHLLSLSWQQGWELVGWTMCWYLALGTGVALIGAVLRLLLRRANPNVRYSLSLAVFALLAALPLPIAYWLAPTLTVNTPPAPAVIDLARTPLLMPPATQAEPADELKPLDPALLAGAMQLEPVAAATGQSAEVAAARPDGETMWAALVRYLPWLWLVGTPVTFLLLATGLIGSQRLRRQCTLVTEGPLADALAALRSSLNTSRNVRLAIHERITSPLLIGIVRPMILLPPSALTGWSPEQVEMVLLHELAHVRRWDNLVNLLQRMIESLLFFHPCVWWVSSWLRAEREQCCDALVVARTAKPQAYAELLVALATPPSPLAGLALSHHPLAGRIRRILHLEEEKMLVTRSTFGLVVLAVAALLGMLLWQPDSRSIAEEPKPEMAKVKDLTTEEAKSAEEVPANELLRPLNPVYVYDIPILFKSADPPEGDQWKEAHQSIIKSFMVETKALNALHQRGLLENITTIDPIDRALKVSFQNNKLHVMLKNKQLQSLSATELKEVADALVSAYVQRISGVLHSDRTKVVFETDAEGNRTARVIDPTIQDSQLVASEAYGGEGGYGGEYFGGYIEGTEAANGGGGGGGEYGGRGGFGGEGGFGRGGEYGGRGEMGMGGRGGRGGYARGMAEASKPASETTTADSPFPSLEEQKAADFAYKLLGLELEKVDAEELQRIKAKKFSGGLRIAHRITGRAYSPQKGDLLVGLHVWPTTSLTDVQTILKRPDLAELSPLKFYVLRRNTDGGSFGGGGYGGGFDDEHGFGNDYLVTGRLTVNVEATKPSGGSYTNKPKPKLRDYTIEVGDELKVMAANVLPDQPISDVYRVESMGTLALGPTYGRVKVAGLTLLEAEEKIKIQLLTVVTEANVQVTLVKSASRGNLQNYTAPRGAVPSLDQPIVPTSPVAPTPTIGILPPLQQNDPPRQPGPPRKPSDPPLKPVEPRDISNYPDQSNLAPDAIWPGEPAKTQATLLYDNKTFNEWRSLWKNELKTEKRIEAIRAMAAFASAGYGKDAAEALLDVAEQYDFYNFDQSTESKLKEKVLEILCTSNDYRIDAELWLPSLLERYRKNPEKVKWLAYQAVSRLRNPGNSETRKQLLALARGEDQNLRSAAVSALTWSQLDDPEVKALSEEYLSSDDPEKAHMGLWLLRRGDMGFGGGGLGGGGGGMGIPSDQPVFRSDAALLAALTHPNEEIRRAARGKLILLPEKITAKVVDQLKESLTKAKDDEKKVALLRAVAVLGKHAAPMDPQLYQLLAASDSRAVKIAAIVALSSHDKGEGLAAGIKAITGTELENKNLTRDRIEEWNEQQMKIAEEVEKEESRLLPKGVQEQAGGGFF